MSSEATAALRDEHRHLMVHVEHLREAAAEIPRLSEEERTDLLGRIGGFLRDDLLPHALREDQVLYPAIAGIYGKAGTTDAMTADHTAIGDRVAELETTDVSDAAKLQELLYGLHALISVHFHKEEDVYMPLLERQPDDEVRALLARMHHAEAS